MNGAPEITGKQAQRANDALRTLLWSGLAVSILAGIIIGASWSDTETGGSGGVVFGFIVAGVGNLMLLSGLIGYGVKTGVRAASDPSD